jgi:hypothetical protein
VIGVCRAGPDLPYRGGVSDHAASLDDLDVAAMGLPRAALVEADGPFFTTPHWDGYRGVLLRERDLPRLGRDELVEVVTDAWLARAPRRLAKEYLGGA